MKKLEIEKTKPTFIISVLKIEYWVPSLANKWMSFSSSNLALVISKIYCLCFWVLKIYSAMYYFTKRSNDGLLITFFYS